MNQELPSPELMAIQTNIGAAYAASLVLEPRKTIASSRLLLPLLILSSSPARVDRCHVYTDQLREMAEGFKDGSLNGNLLVASSCATRVTSCCVLCIIISLYNIISHII